MASIVDEVVKKLKKEVAELPEGFYDTFVYTKRGRNFTHPITLGMLAKILWAIKGVKHVAVDFRLNDKSGGKFQPDLVALAGLDEPLQPLLFIDYESPNSSDIRIPEKDVKAYRAWSEREGCHAPYIIITTLPVEPSVTWELRYTSKDSGNARYRGKRQQVRESPQKFWYTEYEMSLKNVSCDDVYFVNISGHQVEKIKVQATS